MRTVHFSRNQVRRQAGRRFHGLATTAWTLAVIACVGSIGACAASAPDSGEAPGSLAAAEPGASPGPDSADAVCGSFRVSGEIEHAVDPATVSEPRLASHGGWDVSLHDDAYVLMLKNVPGELAVGDYPFATEMPSVPADWDWETSLDFPLHVVLAERSDTGGFDKMWDDDVTGTFTVEVIEGERVTGRFEFTDGSVQVLGSFCNLAIPASAEVASAVDTGTRKDHGESPTDDREQKA